MPSSTRSHSRSLVLRWIAAPIAALLAIGLCLLTNDNVTASVRERMVERLNARIENVYTDDYQSMADEQLAQMRAEGERDLDDALVVENPYGTNTTSLYVWFSTNEPAAVTYTVSADGYPDFTRTAAQNEDFATEHEFTVLGLIPDVTNTITFTLTDAEGETIGEREIKRRGPSLLGNEEVRLEATVEPAADADLGDGLYAVLGNDSNEQDFMFYYDTDGVLRGEVPVLYYRSHRLLFDDEGLMWFSASTRHFVGMNRLGKLEKIIDLGGQYILHHDYQLDSEGDIVSLATDLTREDHAVQDQVIKVDTDSGEVTGLVDFGEIFPEYKAATTHSGIDESDPTATGRWDWIHFNTIDLTDDGGAVLSARETSTMIKIADLESDPSVEYMIGEKSVWDGFDEYQGLFLEKDGDFPDTGGQHSVTVVDDDATLENGQYYLYMFDNNFGYAMTRPDYDWTAAIDGISTAQSSKDPDSNSQYRRYLVDENAGTYREVAAFEVPYSPYVSSAQELAGTDGNILIDSGMQGLISTYSPDGELLAQYHMQPSTSYLYRVYQYDFDGFYFA